jgi:hypothetical protein
MPIPVPRFKLSEIKIADICAREIWMGKGFVRYGRQPTSEEELLERFAPSGLALKNSASATNFSLDSIDKLAKVSKLQNFQYQTPYQNGINHFHSTVYPTYTLWKNGSNKLKRHQYPTEINLNWNKLIEPTSQGPKGLRTHERIQIANRVLFFALPEMPFFITSKFLRDKVGLFGNNKKKLLKVFNDEMAEGLKLNKSLLSKFTLPPATTMNSQLWGYINQSDWWQRRVLDLAMLIHQNQNIVFTKKVQKKIALLSPKKRKAVKKKTKSLRKTNSKPVSAASPP